MEEERGSRYSRAAQVLRAYESYACYVAHEPSTAVQVFWYEFFNDSLTPDEQNFFFKKLSDATSIQSKFLLRILSVTFQAVPPRFVVITEAMQAPTLSEYLHGMKNPLPIRTCVLWFRSLCNAVQTLHEANVVHGAISLQNAFIIQRTGSIKLKMPLQTLSGRPAPRCAIDLNQYKAPETLRGGFSRANDIWSLAIILLEMITNVPAYAECTTSGRLIDALLDHRKPEALALVQSRLIADFLEACLVPEEARLTIEAVLAHPVLAESTALGEREQSPSAPPNAGSPTCEVLI
jgi:serine/threonine protein kinase